MEISIWTAYFVCLRSYRMFISRGSTVDVCCMINVCSMINVCRSCSLKGNLCLSTKVNPALPLSSQLIWNHLWLSKLVFAYCASTVWKTLKQRDHALHLLCNHLWFPKRLYCRKISFVGTVVLVNCHVA